jgi:MFS family permease
MVIKMSFKKDRMFYKFSMYGFLKNLRFFDPFMVLFFREVGFSFFAIGSLYAIRDISTNLLEIPTGIYADIFGRRKSMIMAFVSYIISFSVFYFFSNYYFYALAMVFFAFGEAFRSGTHKALILEYLRINHMEDVKVDYYGHTRAASQFGSAISSLIAAALVFYSGSYRYIFIASVIPYVLDLINLSTYPKELDGEIGEVEKGALKKQMKATLKDFVMIFKNFEAMRVVLNSSSFSAFFKVSKEYLQPILKIFALSLPLFLTVDKIKRTSLTVGIVYFVIYLLTSYASRNSAKISKKFKNLPSAVNATYFAGAALIFLAGLSMSYKIQVLSILFLLVLYVLQNFRRPMNVSLISDKISHKTMASGLSVESQITTVLMAIFAPLMGIVADKISIGWALALFGIFMFTLGSVVRVRSTT